MEKYKLLKHIDISSPKEYDKDDIQYILLNYLFVVTDCNYELEVDEPNRVKYIKQFKNDMYIIYLHCYRDKLEDGLSEMKYFKMCIYEKESD